MHIDHRRSGLIGSGAFGLAGACLGGGESLEAVASASGDHLTSKINGDFLPLCARATQCNFALPLLIAKNTIAGILCSIQDPCGAGAVLVVRDRSFHPQDPSEVGEFARRVALSVVVHAIADLPAPAEGGPAR